MLRLHIALAAALVAPVAVHAADPTPEIQRDVASPQATGKAHTLRTIPEACARLEGKFTGNPVAPYDVRAVRSSERCGARARLVDAAKAGASVASGWVLNDVIRVPSAACPAQQAVVRVWRKDTKVAPPKRDAQGRSRIYLKEGLDAARDGELKPVPTYAAAMVLEGQPCR